MLLHCDGKRRILYKEKPMQDLVNRLKSAQDVTRQLLVRL